MRGLSALVAASRREDRYGVVLLCDPNLADILTTLASAVLALRQYTRVSVGVGGLTVALGQVLPKAPLLGRVGLNRWIADGRGEQCKHPPVF